MSRSGYSEDLTYQEMSFYRQAVAKAIGGSRGQTFLKEMLVALDALPEKLLVKSILSEPEVGVCAIGSVGVKRGIDLSLIDSEDFTDVANAFGIAESLAREIEWVNDECGPYNETEEARFIRVRKWIVSQILEPV